MVPIYMCALKSNSDAVLTKNLSRLLGIQRFIKKNNLQWERMSPGHLRKDHWGLGTFLNNTPESFCNQFHLCKPSHSRISRT